MKSLLRDLTPPLLWRTLQNGYRRLHGTRCEWERIPGGWEAAVRDARIKGWNVEGVLDTYREKWPTWVQRLEGSDPLALSHEAAADFYGARLPTITAGVYHNIVMSYAYALLRASRGRRCVRLLDWGGGIGHYYPLSRALAPDVEIDYHCKDVPLLAAHGQELFPEARFYSDESCLKRCYDLVLVSGSLHYSQDWESTLARLAGATGGYLYVTRLPMTVSAPSCVFVQRAYAYGYDTEYVGWCLNRDEFLAGATRAGLCLAREFVLGEEYQIRGQAEACVYRGFLFQPAA